MSSPPWWQRAIFYQIYPRSFQDSNHDGIGDLPGIIERLDHVKDLGTEAIWLSPFYPSPMKDFGYDISDYCAVHPMFGTMTDFDELLDEVHARELKLILDLVPNHTSDEHPWFKESRKSRDNPKRDWYIWRDPAPDGGPPNNWLSCFGGPAWTFDAQTGQYYLHSFVRQQPDLNYRNPEVVDAMLAVMRFWLDKGIDGFRVDVIEFMLKHPDFPDEPENPHWDGVEPYQRLEHIYSRNQREVHAVIRQMRKLVDAYGDKVLIGEVFVFEESIMAYYGNGDECHYPFNFWLIYQAWSAPLVRQAVNRFEAALPEGAWPNWVLGNHDQKRVATRIGPAQARLANMLLLTLRGTPTSYYGEELGMENVAIPPEKVQDPPAVNQPEVAHIFGRDPERTPMQWDDSPHAGFCAPEVEPWLPVAEDYQERNVAQQRDDPASMLNLYKALATLRRLEPSLSLGDYTAVDVGSHADDIFAYTRNHPQGDPFLIVLNMSQNAHTLELEHVAEHADIAVASDMTRRAQVTLSALELAPNEGLVLRLPRE